MIKSRYNRAYKKNGKTSYPETINKIGVYLVKDLKNNIVYVGFSQNNLYKTMYRHFQSWNDEKQYRAVFPKDYKIRVVLTNTKKRAKGLEAKLILKHRPKFNKTLPPSIDEANKFFDEIEADYFNTYTTNNDDLPF